MKLHTAVHARNDGLVSLDRPQAKRALATGIHSNRPPGPHRNHPLPSAELSLITLRVSTTEGGTHDNVDPQVPQRRASERFSDAQLAHEIGADAATGAAGTAG